MTAPRALVSVTIPTHNCAAYAERAVESIRAQTYADLEILIGDDASTDDTAARLAALARADDRIRLWVRDENLGAARNANLLNQAAEGDFVANLDGDDVAHPERIARQVAFMTRHPEVDILGTALATESGQRFDVQPLAYRHADIVEQLPFLTAVHKPTLCVRAHVWKTLAYDAALPAAIDFDFLLRAHQAGMRFANLPEALVTYRVNRQGLSAAARAQQLFHVWRAHRRVLAPDPGPLPQNPAALGRAARLFLAVSARQRHDTAGNRALRTLVAPWSELGRFYLTRRWEVRRFARQTYVPLETA